MPLNLDIQYVKGVGPKRAKLLKKLGINTVEDLLFYFPKDYENRSDILKIEDLKVGEKQTFRGYIAGSPREIKTSKVIITKVPVKDGTGAVELVWYNQPYIKNNFKIGEEYIINGKLQFKYGQLIVENPVLEKSEDFKLNTGRIVPIYGLTEGLTQNAIRKIMFNALHDYVQEVEEFFDEEFLSEKGLMDIKNALININFPQNEAYLEQAKYRFKYQELFLLQMALFLMKRSVKEKKGIKFEQADLKPFLMGLPFKLTLAQIKVLKEIIADMNSHKVMNRLVQGDVGSGKTVVAACSMYIAVKNGYQVAMMAPTEILAKQHYYTLKELFRNTDIKIGLLSGSISPSNKKEVLEKIKNGDYDIVVGTHALIEDNVIFNNLGLCITDEQHRFGVRQRALLTQKGENPDVLVMTATPIPRTFALILYGDLDISIIDQLPPGRKKVKTYVISSSVREKAYEFAMKEVKKGRQVYVVCPLIEESDKINAMSAEIVYREIYKDAFKEAKVGLLHGKMADSDKEKVMEEFVNGKIDILVSTTVIEVGVNVPNATVMIVENAERFGLAQLHQLRGRVGRSEFQSYCILISYSNSDIAKKRLGVLAQTSDGFKIAEKDLEIRGPGEFLGLRQHGLPEFKIANIFEDIDVLKRVQKDVEELLEKDPKLENYPKLRSILLNQFYQKLEGIILN
ncbi:MULTISPECIES: ATP-dependent DNA helicase RecG [Thermoanaerobacter]|uniref:ATP-dependent DNA helicase RecG n=2 Tax=Thermoanaerobacter TaxID=1754 RepID=B0K9Z6_THEP3|nr:MULTISPECIES: ATP-dependent DNA helicase RecG [Thermoanaerobacter]ABY94959.1 ATP-dependent DNA helicase RecG [Thermoanaerobacter pseudethanolicus ATCC 33223]ADV79908.1 ATP-dependent DNA helicase RecG [Thermoanaerobacter brockii subsp. finnii Ako-1]HBW58851.1 DNA helicase RecG [Thermoanaerobacter sp.]